MRLVQLLNSTRAQGETRASEQKDLKRCQPVDSTGTAAFEDSSAVPGAGLAEVVDWQALLGDDRRLLQTIPK